MYKVRIPFTIKVLTGLHIGASNTDIQIGAIENSVVKDERGLPYIPASSIKGKMRCLLERSAGKYEIEKDWASDIGKLFGVPAGSKENDDESNDEYYYSRLIIRDAELKDDNVDIDDIIEIKNENQINIENGKKITATPRPMERVVPDTEFISEFIITLPEYEKDNNEKESKLIKTLKNGIELLEYDYLGGSGTRGYGRIEIIIDFDNIKVKKYGNKVNDNSKDLKNEVCSTLKGKTDENCR